MIAVIKTFIEDFKKFGTGKEIIDCFSYGYCYWFARILLERFGEGEIMYCPVDNHFVYAAFGRVFDITGDCTAKYRGSYMTTWASYKEMEDGSTHLDGLIKNCVLKERN